MTIRASKIKILLAVLLVRSGEVVTTGQLMTEIWGDGVPRRAMAGIHVYVSQLRKVLRRPEQRESQVVTCSPGYMLQLGDDELDVKVFTDLVKAGKESVRDGRHAEAVTRLQSALGLWRGPAFDELRGGPILEGFDSWLAELRIGCVQTLIDAQFELGRHREVIGQLHSLVAEHPLREAFYRQLMVALYRSERQAEALGVYQAARRVLVDELGLEPGRALQELHAAILRADGDLDAGRSEPVVPRPRWEFDNLPALRTFA
ncbi:AfsR/SARP family transcriptional regulator [Amycolatopsis sp. NPDC024027]|uniref:AfsR/SARP family transcriptional regulator n=1 Tax=Amycolatopsis sp. NPDC024027 TaxID=3154327 RepID=UPI0033CE2878